jgi:thiosulfate/3-mercaptopyruvate sulfurtransferase
MTKEAGSPIVSVEVLKAWIDAGTDVHILDVRHQLMDKTWGRHQFAAGHIPGARFVDVDSNLSDLSRAHELGRHPLPSAETFVGFLKSLRIHPDAHVVCYDQDSGAFAARAWWMLRAVGLANVSVLDGGMVAWQCAGLDVQVEVSGKYPPFTDFEWRNPSFDAMPQIELPDLKIALAKKSVALIDARAANRFAGRDEVIDPIAGHVPGAKNRPFTENLMDGRFKSPAQLKKEFSALLADTDPNKVAMMCGSGVTACHNLLAMELAGLRGGKLFAPSWSGWILQSIPDIATGES